MRQPMCSLVGALVLFTYSATAFSDDTLTAIEYEIPVPTDIEEFLNSSQVIRYRFVRVNVEMLWETLSAEWPKRNIEDSPIIELEFFEGRSFEMRVVDVNYNYWFSSGTLVNNSPSYRRDPDANIFATIYLKRDAKGASISIYAAGEHYTVMPLDDGPNHVVVQLDPDKMPDMD